MTDKATCTHERLYFGSGAFYVICRDCSQFWVALKGSGNDLDLDYSQGKRHACSDDRVREHKNCVSCPDLQTPTRTY